MADFAAKARAAILAARKCWFLQLQHTCGKMADQPFWARARTNHLAARKCLFFYAQHTSGLCYHAMNFGKWCSDRPLSAAWQSDNGPKSESPRSDLGQSPSRKYSKRNGRGPDATRNVGKVGWDQNSLSMMTNDFFLNLAGSWPPRGPNHQRVFDIGHCTKHIPHLSRRGISPGLAGRRRCEPRGQLGICQIQRAQSYLYNEDDEGL